MKKLLSTLLAVMLAVTMLTGMAIPAQAAENDIFNPGVLELDGSAKLTLSSNADSAFFSFTPEKKGCYEFRLKSSKLKSFYMDLVIADNYMNDLATTDMLEAAEYTSSSDTICIAKTLEAGERYMIYAVAYNAKDLSKAVEFTLNVNTHTHDTTQGKSVATKYEDGQEYKLCKYCDEYKG